MKLTNPFNSPRFQKAKPYLLGTIIGALILEVVGNLFADLVKGTPGFLLSATLRTATFLFRNYVETIHRDVGEARSDELAQSLYVLVGASIVAGTGVAMLIGLKLSRENYKRTGDRLKEAEQIKLEVYGLAEPAATTTTPSDETKSPEDLLKERVDNAIKGIETDIKDARRTKWQMYGFAVVVLYLCFNLTSTLMSDVYTRGASTFVERSIEILAPTIPPDKILQLRARYRSVDSAQKFYELHDELHAIAKEKNATLPKFTPIKR
jgi:hypothetical protein